MVLDADVDWGRLAWVAFGAVLAAALVVIAHTFVGTLVFGLFIYYATRRVHRRVRRRLRPASVAAGFSLFLLALPALALVAYTVAVALGQLNAFAAQLDGGGLMPLLNRLGPYLDLSRRVQDPATLLTELGGTDALRSSLETLAGYFAVVGTGLLHVFVMLALAFYLLRDGPKFGRWLDTYTDSRGVLDAYLAAVDRSLDSVFYGNILNALITGVIGAIAFSLLNVVAPPGIRIPYPALVGLLTGVASLVPVVGMKLVYVPVALYLAVMAALGGGGWWFVVLFVAVSFLVVDVIPDFIVRPYVSGGTLHTGALMFAYIFGPLLFGWYGIFLGPMLLVLVVHFVRIVLPELLTGEPIRPYSVDPGTLVGEGQVRPADDAVAGAERTAVAGGAGADDGGADESVAEENGDGDESVAEENGDGEEDTGEERVADGSDERSA